MSAVVNGVLMDRVSDSFRQKGQSVKLNGTQGWRRSVGSTPSGNHHPPFVSFGKTFSGGNNSKESGAIVMGISTSY